ncbi:unnamed protein product [Prunus armeniaca]
MEGCFLDEAWRCKFLQKDKTRASKKSQMAKAFRYCQRASQSGLSTREEKRRQSKTHSYYI